MTARELARHVAEAASDTKAKDIVVLDLRALTSFTDYFVICSGTSDRQVRAILNAVREKSNGRKPIGVEGEDFGRWVLVDYGDVVAHIFHQVERDFYQIEKLWGDAPHVRFRL